MKPAIHIFPRPQEISLGEESFGFEGILRFHAADEESRELLDRFQGKLNLCEAPSEKAANLSILRSKQENPEGYRLQIDPRKITLGAETKIGAFRALVTLVKILNQNQGAPSAKIPCLKIRDFPILARRGFMLDVSRCKVPKLDALFAIIDSLASLGYNELQLYVEHTFAFRDHSEVWKDASPYTADEIKEIDLYCRQNFIELVPNLNSFGHFERWLRHPGYHYLAECPQGFRRDEPFMERDHGSTLKPNRESLEFVNRLYDEYLPNFSSRNFNVGLDEPWELGQGWSAEQVGEFGKGAVYLKHLKGILKLVEKQGRNMQFWADVLLEDPANAKFLPPSAKPIIWGYEADHPFSEQARTVSACGLSFCLAPGTATWRSFSGRWPTAKKNVANAVENATRYGAEGILLTSWGDCGNHQPWPTFFPAMFYAGQRSWNGREISDQLLGEALNLDLFKTSAYDPGSLLMDLGRLDLEIGSSIPNASVCWNLFFSPQPQELPPFLERSIPAAGLQKGIEFLDSLSERIDGLGFFSGSESFIEEISLGVALSRLALQYGQSLMGVSSKNTSCTANQLLDRFRSNWLRHARPGGLEESAALLSEALVGRALRDSG